ncbi:hypothetical protein HK28_10235 [Acetobacter sp. DsW_063]|nr:hypothetical protein HK28_10235 [Acetobacter sp. DsW_063]
MKKYQCDNAVSLPGHITNYLGVHTSTDFFPGILSSRGGEIEPIPFPANWHTDIAEWGAALRAVDLSGASFSVLELGCGWGCWMNNTGAAARTVGKDVHLMGVEGDPDYIKFATSACMTNGFSVEEFEVLHGVAATESGVALFPKQEIAGGSWGLEPIFGATSDVREAAAVNGSHIEIPMVSLRDIVASERRFDLLHMDIQGGEVALVSENLDLMSQSIAYVVIGTHSREIEGRLIAEMSAAGWVLEMERPCIFSITAGRTSTTVDGVQGWRNTVLLP